MCMDCLHLMHSNVVERLRVWLWMHILWMMHSCAQRKHRLHFANGYLSGGVGVILHVPISRIKRMCAQLHIYLHTYADKMLCIRTVMLYYYACLHYIMYTYECSVACNTGLCIRFHLILLCAMSSEVARSPLPPPRSDALFLSIVTTDRRYNGIHHLYVYLHNNLFADMAAIK